jgi:hypothetical protein
MWGQYHEILDDMQDSLYYRYWRHTIGHKIIPNYGVRNEQYKLIFYYGVTSEDTHNPEINIEAEWELYDLEADSLEMNSVYRQSEFEEVEAVMLTQ